MTTLTRGDMIFRRLQLGQIVINDGQWGVVVSDPPRLNIVWPRAVSCWDDYHQRWCVVPGWNISLPEGEPPDHVLAKAAEVLLDTNN